MKERGFSTKKRFGQNFLIDQNIVGRIIQTADLQPDEWVLEIGPGLGALTMHLGEQAAHVVAMEIDRGLAAILRDTLVSPTVTVWEGDALEADWEQLLLDAAWQGERLKLVANLPYYLTTPLVMKALESNLPFVSIVVMVQREVGLRMLAQPGSSDYGVLSLAVQYYCQASLAFAVPRTVFLPAPSVDSVVVVLKPKPPQVDAPRAELFTVIRAAFQQRRKTIRNALREVAAGWGLDTDQLEQALHAVEIEPTLRGERLSLEEYSRLTKELLKGV
jgi:16S rRNA (adenine1518-N6/adenine1519-N6)-dimethyltransferase